MFQDLLFTWSRHDDVAPRWPWNCGRFPPRLIRLKSQPLPFLLSVGEANGNEKAKAFDLVHELSIVAQSIESQPLSEKKWSMKVRGCGNNPQCFLYRPWPRLLCCHGSQSETKRNFSIQCEGFAAGELKHGTIAWSKTVHRSLPLLSDPVLASHHTWKCPRSGSTGLMSQPLQKKMSLKETDDLVLTQGFTLSLPNLNGGANPIDCHFATLHRGLDVDKPRNLAKSVTVE